MKSVAKNEEIRWQVLKAMIDEFPSLKERARKYIRGQESEAKNKAATC